MPVELTFRKKNNLKIDKFLKRGLILLTYITYYNDNNQDELIINK